MFFIKRGAYEMRQKMREQCNRRKISTFIVIAVCLTGVVIPAMTQPSNVIPSTPLYTYEPVFHGNNIFCESLIVYVPAKGFSKSTENEIEEQNNAEFPDLTASNITFFNKNGNAVSLDKLIARENHTIQVNVKNAGCVAATDFYVKLYVNKSGYATSDEPVAGFPRSEQIARLEPGVTSEVDFSWTPPEAGFYRVKVVVDEKNEGREEKKHVKELEGGCRVQLTLPWTTRPEGQLERLNVSVDCDNEVHELSENNNNVSQLVAVADREIIPIFDTGSSDNPYPSISGIHKGTIRLNHTITVNKMYTYACPGTGGHTEYIELSNESGIVAIGHWTGYTGDRHNISFYPSFRMLANHTYNYTIRTGSYPQIHHTSELKAKGGMGIINCTSFVDANGRSYINRIPAIRLEGNFVDDNLPDLEVNEIEAYYTNTDIRYLNLNNDVKVKITNNGSIKTGPFEIKLVVNAEDVDIKTSPALEPNSSTYVVFTWTPTFNVTRPPLNADHVSENYTLNAIVDPENRIIESNETNNRRTVNVSAIWNGRMGGNGVFGDPYITTQHHGKLHGGTIYTFGDSYKYWKHAVQPGNPYTVKYDVTLPPGAKVELANIYTYFEWFVTEQPKADVTFATLDGENHLSIEEWYWDKAYAFIFGQFLWGVLKYDVTPYINGNGTYNFSLKHDGGPKYFVDGALLFLVYRDESEPLVEYWMSEGADLIGGRDIEYLRYEDTTAKAEFTGGEIDIANVTNVTLFSVVNWGFQTDLWFNGHLLGKECFTSIHPDQEEIAQYNVTRIPAEYLNTRYNLVEMQFRGYCRNMPANAVLVVEYKEAGR